MYLGDVNFKADTLELFFSLGLPSAKYWVIIDDSITNGFIVPANNSLHISLMPGIYQYKLVAEDNKQPAIIVQADHAIDPENNYINEFIYCNLPGPQIKVSSFKTWTKGIASFTDDEVKNANEFLTNNTHAFSANTDSARLMEVCRVISALRPNINGIKAFEVSALSPYKQLQLARQNKVNLDCGNYSVMIYFFCSVLNLPNRVITFSGPAGNWRYGVHYYNEVYLREKQQWVLCDGLSNNYMPHDSIHFYNAADVNKLAHLNSFKDKYVYTFEHDSLKRVAYDSLNYWHWYYNRNNADLRYIHPGNNQHDSRWTYLKDFYSFSRNFDFYSDVNANDWLKIIVKMIAFYFLIIVTVLYIMFEIRTFRSK